MMRPLSLVLIALLMLGYVQSAQADGGQEFFEEQVAAMNERQRRREEAETLVREVIGEQPQRRITGQLAPKPAPNLKMRVVQSDGRYGPGTVAVFTRLHEVRLYHRNGTMTVYPVGVGRQGFGWQGRVKVCRAADLWVKQKPIHWYPRWWPTKNMIIADEAKPDHLYRNLAQYLPDGMPPVNENPNNPFGVIAIRLCDIKSGMYLLYNLHGTAEKDRPTVGYNTSSGCFRMFDEHASHLAGYLKEGTSVVVVGTPGDKPVEHVVAELRQKRKARIN